MLTPYGYTQFKLIIQEYEKAHDYKYHNVYEAAKEMRSRSTMGEMKYAAAISLPN